ncbi:hypothetical protein BS47DRAFT_1376624 [Hydnum rufescens UP504]|uniref:t-SNARE coiled-coil homology domain-containing protein n=1 Tax=Hydnum rufescens UP504 TaxID=1448309 RepID=A0A9P6AXT7_9AGAM|nr:hypothetical protein BS47DRAFT_1376624 [Hydnum rufescens UP504]
MSVDPYHAVQADIQTSLQAASSLRSSFLRIRSTASKDSEELRWVRDEGTLATLEADLEDLEASVKIVEDTGGRMFGLEEREVMARRKFVDHVRAEIENMRYELLSPEEQARVRSRPLVVAPLESPDTREDDQAAWSREEQQMMMHQQDETLTSISGTLTTLAAQAGLIGQETMEQNELLDDLGRGVDGTESKLSGAMKKMQRFIRQTEERGSGWCISILIIILIILLVAVTASLATFITALVTNLVVFGAEIAVFTLLRQEFKVIYSPRTYIPPASKRADALQASLLTWPLAVYNLDYDDIRRQNGLDRFTFGNISRSDQDRYAAHLILAYIFTFWILYVVKDEMRNFITVRQKHLMDPAYAATAQSRTVLITGIPLAISSLLLFDPCSVRYRETCLTNALQLSTKLESAETTLLNTAAKLEIKKQKNIAKGKGPQTEKNPTANVPDPERNISLADQLVPRKERPTHRLKPFSFLPFGLPFIGEKVDSIEWCRAEIVRLNAEIQSRQDEFATEMAMEKIPAPADGKESEGEKYPRLTSAFVLFNEQVAAQMAAQTLLHHEPYRMAERHVDMAPADVIWSNLNLNPYESKIRTAISYAATLGLILLWAIPVAFVGAISNIHSLCNHYHWLAWICSLPGVVVGIISGLLPPVMLAVLMMLLPIVLRLLAQFEGIPRRTGLELSLMTRFFIFQVIHSFLIVSLSSGLIQALGPLSNNLSQAPTLLATNLPGASTFFLTYILLQLSAVAGGFLQIVPLIVYYVKLFLLGSTPRSRPMGDPFPYHFPPHGRHPRLFCYFTTHQRSGLWNFLLLFQLWKYLFMYQLDMKPSSDTGGLFFPKAMTHIFIGLYVEQICLTALFFLSQNDRGHPSSIPEGALMIVLVVLTAGFHLVLIDSYGPLLKSIPLSLVDRAYQLKLEELESPPSNERVPLNRSEDYYEMGPVLSNEPDQVSVAESSRKRGEDGPSDFHHPALGPARIIWIPQDTLGLGAAEEHETAAAGVDVSTANAFMSAKGTVDVSGAPPGG